MCKQIARRLILSPWIYPDNTLIQTWAEGRSDQLHVRPTSVNDRHSGGRPMNGADKLLSPTNIIWVMRLPYRDGEVGTVSPRDERIYSSVDIWTGLKIEQVTVKFAAATQAKVNAASVSAYCKQHWGRGTERTTDRWTDSKWYLLPQIQASSVGSSNLLKLFQFVTHSLVYSD